MVIQPEVVSFIGIVDWQIPLGPPHISHWHPVLDRRLFIRRLRPHAAVVVATISKYDDPHAYLYTWPETPHTPGHLANFYQSLPTRTSPGSLIRDMRASRYSCRQSYIRFAIMRRGGESGRALQRSARPPPDPPPMMMTCLKILFAHFLNRDFVLSDLTLLSTRRLEFSFPLSLEIYSMVPYDIKCIFSVGSYRLLPQLSRLYRVVYRFWRRQHCQ